MTATVATREVGRPRVFSDTVIFATMEKIIRQEGYHELTLEAIAIEVGCTRQALVRRFGSKHELVLAFLDSLVTQLTGVMDRVEPDPHQPLQTFLQHMAAPPGEGNSLQIPPDQRARMIAFLLTASSEPDYAVLLARLNQAGMAVIERQLRAAVAKGELEPIDTTLVARVLFAAHSGETIDWCVQPATDLPTSMARTLAIVIDPYRRMVR